MEQLCKNRNAKVVTGGAPVETFFAGWGMVPRPQHPRRKHPVKERLHQHGAKKVIALLVLELDSKRLFERAADGGQRWHIAFLFHAPQGLARIRGHEPGSVFGVARDAGWSL